MARLLAAVIGAVMVLAAIVTVLWLVVAVATIAGVFYGTRSVARNYRQRAGARRHARAELLARAEIQHRWFLAGDPRGTYGRYSPAVRMR